MIETDTLGYLRNRSDWTPAVAEKIATQEGLVLTAAHWELITCVRDFYQQYQLAPSIRVLVKALKERYGSEKGNSLYVQTLFPQAAKQLSKIAGLPKPVHCT